MMPRSANPVKKTRSLRIDATIFLARCTLPRIFNIGIFLSFSLAIHFQTFGQDASPVFTVVIVEGNVSVDGRQVKPGQTITTESQTLTVGESSRVGTLTVNGRTAYLNEGIVEVKRVQEQTDGAPSTDIHYLPGHSPRPVSSLRVVNARSTGQVPLYKNEIWLLLSRSVQDKPVDLRLENMFGDIGMSTMMRDEITIKLDKNLIREQVIILTLSFKGLTSGQYYLRPLTGEGRRTIRQQLHHFRKLKGHDRTLLEMALFELRGCYYDMFRCLRDLQRIETTRKQTITHLYYRRLRTMLAREEWDTAGSH